MNGDQEQEQAPQQPQRQQQQTPLPQFSFHSVSASPDSSTLAGSARYQYKSKKLPAKPKVLESGENLSAPATGGVEQYETAS